jgi:hypothetical protein
LELCYNILIRALQKVKAAPPAPKKRADGAFDLQDIILESLQRRFAHANRNVDVEDLEEECIEWD